MKKDALRIVKAAIKAADPYENTKRILEDLSVFEEINVICSREMLLESAEYWCIRDYFLLNFCRKQFQDMDLECEMCVSGKFNTNIPFPNFARK